MRRRSLAGVVVAALAAAVLINAPWSSPRASEKLRFSDTFNGTKLSPEHWRTCHWWTTEGCTLEGNDELEWYVPEQVQLRDGQLRLVAARRTERKPLPYVSGMVTTGPGPEDAPRFAFTYGRAEIRARLPPGRGLWPAFWLLPADRESKPEIDVLEVYGSEPETLRMHLHYRDGDGRTTQRGKDWKGLTPGWHRFAIDWRPDRLTWLVDGKARWEVRGSAVPSEPMYLVLNLAVGGSGPGSPDDATEFPASFAVDWVKVWR